jgi:oligosaccharide repeat unit polymerase
MKVNSDKLFRVFSFLVFILTSLKILKSTSLDSIHEAILINLAGIFFAVTCGGIRKNLFDPWNQILAVWALIGTLHPLARYLSTESYFRGQFGIEMADSLPKASILFSSGALITLFGISMGRRNKNLTLKPLDQEKLRLPVVFEVFIVLVWIFGSLLLIRQIGFSGLTQWRSRQTQTALLSVSSYLFFTNYLLIVPGLLRLLRKNRTSVDKGIGLSMLYAPVILNVLSGNRIFVIPILILHFYIYSSNSKNITFTRIIIAILVIFLVISGLRLLRESSDPYSRFTSSSFIEQQLSIFEGQDLAMLDNLSLLVRADERNDGVPFVDYLNILTRPIPRQLWPSKPLTFDQKINQLLLPSKAQAGYGFSFTFIGEAFYQLGYLGVLIICFFYGIFLGRCTIWSRSDRNVRLKVIGLISICFIVVFVRGSFSADSPRLLFSLLPLLFIQRVPK